VPALARVCARRVARFLLPALFLASSGGAFAADEAKIVALSATPAQVQKTVATQVADGKIDEIEQTTEDGETIFDVSFTTKNGVARGVSVADDGTAVSVEVRLDETPPAVQKAIHTQAAGWTVEGIDRTLDEAESSFDVEVSQGGRERTFSIAADGSLLSTAVALSDTPVAVQAAIRSQVGEGSVQSVEEDLDPDGNTFAIVAVTKAGLPQSFTVGLDGLLRSEEVHLEDVPAPARKTILEQVGAGRLLRIDKSLLEQTKHVLPYLVEARKDGKRFDFSVGPKGRFLGFDD
jgi:uncharacterized membrane protein YkoI